MSFQFCPRCAHPLTSKEDGGALRAACPDEACGYIYYANPIPVVAALVEHDARIILARNKAWPTTWYGLITGFLERQETPEAGVLREVEEELGLQGQIESLIGVYPFFRMNQVIIAYHIIGTGTIRLGDELADYKRIRPEKLRPWPFGTGEAVRDWLARRLTSNPT